MDDRANLYWSVRIGEEEHTEKKLSPQFNVGTVLNKTWSSADSVNGFDITDLKKAEGYAIYVKFKDRMGNESLDWKDTGLRVKYSTAKKDPVTGLQALCNAAGDRITVSWTTPPGMDGARVYVNEAVKHNDATGPGAKEWEFTTPKQDTSGVREGKPVTNILRYEIWVEAYSPAGFAPARTLIIWNTEDMFVNQSNTKLIDNENCEDDDIWT
jgi:hypothetical protein